MLLSNVCEIGLLQIIRIRSRMQTRPEHMMNFLLQEDRVTEYDPLISRINIIEKVGERETVKWTSYKPVWPTLPRYGLIKHRFLRSIDCHCDYVLPKYMHVVVAQRVLLP